MGVRISPPYAFRGKAWLKLIQRLGPAHWWRFDQLSGDLIDSVNPSVAGWNLVGGVGPDYGQQSAILTEIGYSVGVNGREFLTTSSEIPVGSFSMGCWVKVNTLGSVQRVFGAGTGANRFRFKVETTGEVTVSGTLGDVTSISQLVPGEWSHIFTQSPSFPSTSASIFFNGVLENTNPATGKLALPEPYFVGQNAGQTLDGFVDECVTFNKLISLSNIQLMIYAAGY